MHSSKLPFAKNIINQAHKYAEAINLSVIAAQKAYTVATGAISLAGVLHNNHSQGMLQSYLEGMLQLAMEGQEAVTQALGTFKDVRADVLVVCQSFLCCTFFFTCCGQLLKNAEQNVKQTEHQIVKVEFSVWVNGQCMPISLHSYRCTHSFQGARDRTHSEDYAKNLGTVLESLKSLPSI
jgi:hypothetical protein